VKPLRREVQIQSTAYIVTISPEGLKITGKGNRKGIELAWDDLVSVLAFQFRHICRIGSAAALNASFEKIR
jgi:hypothetical protein